MAVTRTRVRPQVLPLVRELARRWGRRTAGRLPEAFQVHARAALREALLAVAVLCEEALRRAGTSTQRVRRRVERIPVGPERPRRGRPAQRAR
jgi:hypothetical protein